MAPSDAGDGSERETEYTSYRLHSSVSGRGAALARGEPEWNSASAAAPGAAVVDVDEH